MKNRPEIKTLFESLRTHGDFEKLEPYQDQKLWNELSLDDRELLATMFTMQGEKLLQEGAQGELQVFKNAIKVFPNNSEILLRQAYAYLKYPNHENNARLALDLTLNVLKEEPHHFEAQYIKAYSLVCLGFKLNDPSYFYEADECFEALFWHPEYPKRSSQDFYWHWGVAWHQIAKHSGEPQDYFNAIKKYRKAHEKGEERPLFLNDYANALVEITCLISNIHLLEQASRLYQKVVMEMPESFEGWFNLACTEQRLWELKKEEKHFVSAHESYEKASKCCQKDPAMWFKWGLLFLETGKERKKLKLIEASLDKFQNADNLSPHHSPVLEMWAEALLWIGARTENLNFIKSAEKKITQAIEHDANSPNAWLIYGNSLSELGHYFSSEEEYLKAIDTFHQGINLQKSHAELWYSLAMAQQSLGCLKGETESLSKGEKYFSRAHEFGGDMTPAFWADWGVNLMKLGEIEEDVAHFQNAVKKFERAIRLHNLIFSPSTVNIEWLYYYGCALDYIGDFTSEIKYCEKAVQILSQVMQLAPDHPHVKYQLAVAFTHLGEIVSDVACLQSASQLYDQITRENAEDDVAWSEWGVTLIHLAQLTRDPATPVFHSYLLNEAEEKLLYAASLGNQFAFYHLACLYSITERASESMDFLERAHQDNVLPDVEDMIHDDWLDNIKNQNVFREFISRVWRANK